jgi:hypothetical protein
MGSPMSIQQSSTCLASRLPYCNLDPSVFLRGVQNPTRLVARQLWGLGRGVALECSLLESPRFFDRSMSPILDRIADEMRTLINDTTFAWRC